MKPPPSLTLDIIPAMRSFSIKLHSLSRCSSLSSRSLSPLLLVSSSFVMSSSFGTMRRGGDPDEEAEGQTERFTAWLSSSKGVCPDSELVCAVLLVLYDDCDGGGGDDELLPN